MNIEIPILRPQSTNEAVANASRCAIRTYANNIKYKDPISSQELLDYVRKLDKQDEEDFKQRKNFNARKRNSEHCSIILGILSQVKLTGATEYSIEDLRIFLSKSRKFKSLVPFLTHTLDLLVQYKKITIEDKYIQL